MIQHNSSAQKKYFRLVALLMAIAFFSVAGVVSARENTDLAGIALAFNNGDKEIQSNITTFELTKDNIFEGFIEEEISYAKDSFRGPGIEMSSNDIEVFNLIQNSDISDPEYLEREKGIIVKIKYEGNAMNRLQKTLWSYESDATTIYRIFFTSDYQKEIGFILISFEDQDHFIEDVKFKMTAADSEKFRTSLNTGLYLDRESWSYIEIYPDNQLSMYEDPDTSIKPDTVVKVNDGSTVQKITTDEEFEQFIIRKNNLLNLISQKILRACMDKDWRSASDLSEDLISLSNSVKSEIERMILTEEASVVKKSYLESLDAYHNAAMHLWYGTIFLDDVRIKDGIVLLKEGISMTNNVYKSIGVEPVEEYRVVISSAANIIPDTLKVTEIYKYQDSGKENDISIRIEDFGYKNSLWIKDRDNSRQITSEYGKKYLYIVIDVTHLGFRGGDIEYIITPEKSDFTLFYQGDEIGDSTPVQYIRSLGVPYDEVKLDRREHFEAIMLFSVPDDFNEKDAYISVDLGGDNLPAWSFDYPQNNSMNL